MAMIRKNPTLSSLMILVFLWGCQPVTKGPGNRYGIEDLSSLGVRTEKLVEAYEEADDLGFVSSMIVEYRGERLSQYYFHGYNPYSSFNIRSVSKSMLACLVGIALDRGLIDDLEQKAVDILPQYQDSISDDRFRLINLTHLLTMRAGFATDREGFERIFQSENPLRAIFSESLKYTPGQRMVYSTASTHLLACCLAALIDLDLEEFAHRYLFHPIGVNIDFWETDPQGNYIGGNNVYFQTGDLVLFGNLIQNRGRFENQQLIPGSWVQRMIQNTLEGPGSGYGPLTDIGYGYLWWLGKMSGYNLHTAWGYGGQFVMLIPGLELLIVINSQSDVNWDVADTQELSILNLIRDHIIPAVQ